MPAANSRRSPTFGELRGKRYATAPRSRRRGEGRPAPGGRPGRSRDGRSRGRRARRGRRRAAPRWSARSIGSRSGSPASREAPSGGDAERGGRARRPRRRRGLVRPADDLPRRGRPGPPALDELILVAPGRRAAALTQAAERGLIIARGREDRADAVEPRVERRQPRGPRRRGARHRRSSTACGSTSSARTQATEMGMGMFMAVGRGSDNPPRMIVMRSGGEGERDALGRHLAIVGKGVCFDSGGISIKPSERMEEMKMDKTGACTVIAAMATVARLAPGHAAPRASRRRSRTCPARTRRDPATSSRRSTARRSTSPTPTPRAASSSATR